MTFWSYYVPALVSQIVVFMLFGKQKKPLTNMGKGHPPNQSGTVYEVFIRDLHPTTRR